MRSSHPPLRTAALQGLGKQSSTSLPLHTPTCAAMYELLNTPEACRDATGTQQVRCGLWAPARRSWTTLPPQTPTCAAVYYMSVERASCRGIRVSTLGAREAILDQQALA